MAMTFKAAAGQAFTFSATGLVGCCYVANIGPDGYANVAENITGLGSISGFQAPNALPLVGVFTDGHPSGTPPADYVVGLNDASYAPALNQVFFIGDGLTGTGSGFLQTFAVPANATELWLGFVDGVDFQGSPGAYGDNPGSLAVTGTLYANSPGGADAFLRIRPSTTTIHQGDLLTYAFPVWNLGPGNADHEVLTTQIPAGTTFDYIRISGTPGLGTCTTPAFGGIGQVVCHENSSMAPNTTWTVRLTVQVTAPSGALITESAIVTEDTPDPNLANNIATVSTVVQ